MMWWRGAKMYYKRLIKSMGCNWPLPDRYPEVVEDTSEALSSKSRPPRPGRSPRGRLPGPRLLALLLLLLPMWPRPLRLPPNMPWSGSSWREALEPLLQAAGPLPIDLYPELRPIEILLWLPLMLSLAALRPTSSFSPWIVRGRGLVPPADFGLSFGADFEM